MNITRGETRTINVTLEAAEVAKLPAGFNFIFTVKRILDTDITDSKAIIQKTKVFPEDFTEDEGDYSTSFVLSIEDTTQSIGKYLYDFRVLTNDKTFSKNTTGGTIQINLGPTQRQQV